MPYGVDKSMGGDNKSNDAWMEKCVTDVENSGKSKPSAIAICKAQLKKKRDAKAEYTGIDPEVTAREMVIRWDYIRKFQRQGKMTFNQALASYESKLANQDYDLDHMTE